MGIIEPRRDGDGVIRVEDVGSWRIVKYYGISYRTAELREILTTGKESTGARVRQVNLCNDLDIVSSMVITTFPEQPMSNHFVNIQFI
jgi:hypothetical protein